MGYEEILIRGRSRKMRNERRTHIGYDEFDISMEDLIPRENVVITVTNMGYIKRMSMDYVQEPEQKRQRNKGMQTLEEDFIRIICYNEPSIIILCSSQIKVVYRLKAYEIPEAEERQEERLLLIYFSLCRMKNYLATIPIKNMKTESICLWQQRSC